MQHVLALDFDGLLIDGLDECVLVSWNGFYQKSIDDFGDGGLAAIPKDFIETFKNHRNFTKHLGHFFTPFIRPNTHFDSQERFDQAYAEIPNQDVELFIERVSAYRHAVRESKPIEWLNCHAFYPGVVDFLHETEVPIYIVTAKDTGSVQALLHEVGVALPAERIYGECRDKVKALADIAESLQLERNAIQFYDDNVLNVLGVQQNGFKAHWATWGYHTPAHWGVALANSLPIVDLETFTYLDATVGV